MITACDVCFPHPAHRACRNWPSKIVLCPGHYELFSNGEVFLNDLITAADSDDAWQVEAPKL